MTYSSIDVVDEDEDTASSSTVANRAEEDVVANWEDGDCSVVAAKLFVDIPFGTIQMLNMSVLKIHPMFGNPVHLEEL